MIKEGILEPKPTCCIAQHVYPELEAGKVGFKRVLIWLQRMKFTSPLKVKGACCTTSFAS